MPFEITANELSQAFEKAAQTIAEQEILINKLRAELAETQNIAEKMLDVALKNQKESRTGVALLREVRDFAVEGAKRSNPERKIKGMSVETDPLKEGARYAFNAIVTKIDRLLESCKAETGQEDGV